VRSYRISALGAIVAILATFGAVIVGTAISGGIDSNSTPILAGFLAVIGSTVPSVLALIKVESVSNDIRDGVVEEKVRLGTTKAIEETMVVTRNGPAVMAEIEALRSIVASNNQILEHLVKGREDDGRPSI
jgi:hypothetical protein